MFSYSNPQAKMHNDMSANERMKPLKPGIKCYAKASLLHNCKTERSNNDAMEYNSRYQNPPNGLRSCRIAVYALKIFTLIGCFCTFFVQKARAQEQFVPAQSKLITYFSFKVLSGGVVVIGARLGDLPDTLNFILDTGSGGISLDSSTVDYLNLPVTSSDQTIRGIAGIRKVGFVKDQALQLPHLKVENLNFHINDYEILTSFYGIKIDGIIGYSLFSRYIVKLDYNTNTIEIWQPGLTKYPRGGYLIKPVISNLPVFSASVKDERTIASRFYFDTGAGLCFLMSEDFTRDSGVLKKERKIFLTQAQGVGGKRAMKVTVVKEVKFGPYRFRKVPAYIFNDKYNITAYPQLGGLIGNELLRRFNIIINYPEKEIYITPNKHYNDPFDYSYTGLGIYMENGYIVVEDVIEGSPGEKAGFLPNDIVLAINNQFARSIEEYKALMQSTGSTLKVVILRNNEPKILHLKVKNMLR